LRPRASDGCRRAARRARPGLFALLAILGWPALAAAGSLAVHVAKPDGKPLAGAVVMVHGPAGTAPAKPGSFVIDQVAKSFTPDLTVMPVGSTVTFPNSDVVSHQVYSFSPAKKFQLPLYRGTPYPPMKFDTAGIVTLGCNIHDDMIAYVVVTDAAWFGRTGPDGTWTADGLPAGEFRIDVWHPRLREAALLVEHKLSLVAAEDGRADVVLTRALRPEPLGARPKSWSDY
jgi:plastocyanin